MMSVSYNIRHVPFIKRDPREVQCEYLVGQQTVRWFTSYMIKYQVHGMSYRLYCIVVTEVIADCGDVTAHFILVSPVLSEFTRSYVVPGISTPE